MVDAECPSFQVGEDAMGTQQDDPAMNEPALAGGVCVRSGWTSLAVVVG